MNNKKYIWCFMGQVHSQGSRAEMVKALKKTGGQYYCNVSSGWQSKDSLSTQDYKKILEQSIFVPCPRGNSSLDTFRLYEALESKSIPIVESGQYWHNLLGESHPLIDCSSWEGAASDMLTLSQDEEWLRNYSTKLFLWWKEYKLSLNSKIKTILDGTPEGLDLKASTLVPEPSVFNNLKSKQESFMQLASMWPNFLHKPKNHTEKTLPVVDWLTYCDKNISHPQPEKSQFSCYNGGKEIAIVMMYTPNIYDFAVYSEKSIRQYAEHQGYTLYVYRDNLNKSQHPNWSKPQALLNHISGHSHIIWMDSDTLIFNPEKKFSDIINKYPRKFIIACKDIGGKNGSLFNSGVLIFKNHQYVKNLITRWRDFDGDKSSLYSSGGDQEVLCDIVKRSDSFGFNRKILPFDAFNTDPRLVTKDTFILHFMAYPQPFKRIFMSYWHSK